MSTLITDKKKHLTVIINVFIVLLLIIIAANIFELYYFYIFDSAGHVSDIPDHIDTAMNTGRSHYSLNSIVLRTLINTFNSEFPVVIWLFILTIATGLLNAYIAYLFFEKPGKKYFPTLLLLGMLPFFMGAIYIPVLYEHHYSGTMAATVWHNTTLIEMRFFGILAVLFFWKLMKKIKDQDKFWRDWLFFVIFLFLTVGFKTNFYISFCPVAGIILIVYFISAIKKHDKRTVIRSFVTGASILAVLPVLYFQSTQLFSGGEEPGNHIIVSLGTVYLHSAPNAILKIFLSVLPFAVVFLYALYKKSISKEWLFMFGMLCIDIFVYLVFSESGSRMFHGNFGWGYKFSLYLINFMALLNYLKFVKEGRKEGTKNKDKIFLMLIGLILIASIVSGVVYFYKITWGGMSYRI